MLFFSSREQKQPAELLWRHCVNGLFATPVWHLLSFLLIVNMVSCCVPECTNYSAKTKGVSYHRIPKDVKLRESWIERLGRLNLPALENCYVCSVHFTEDCFEYSLKDSLTGQEGKRTLKRDAVPSVFSFGVRKSKQPRLASVNRTAKRKKEELRHEVSRVKSSRSLSIEDMYFLEIKTFYLTCLVLVLTCSRCVHVYILCIAKVTILDLLLYIWMTDFHIFV